MKTMLKRSLALMLTVLMVVGTMLPSNVFAAEDVTNDVIYSAKIEESTNGSVAFKDQEDTEIEAKMGDEISLIATADDGYQLDMISAKTESGSDVEIKDGLSLVMPAENITITAVFVAVENEPSTDDVDESSETIPEDENDKEEDSSDEEENSTEESEESVEDNDESNEDDLSDEKTDPDETEDESDSADKDDLVTKKVKKAVSKIRLGAKQSGWNPDASSKVGTLTMTESSARLGWESETGSWAGSTEWSNLHYNQSTGEAIYCVEPAVHSIPGTKYTVYDLSGEWSASRIKRAALGVWYIQNKTSYNQLTKDALCQSWVWMDTVGLKGVKTYGGKGNIFVADSNGSSYSLSASQGSKVMDQTQKFIEDNLSNFTNAKAYYIWDDVSQNLVSFSIEELKQGTVTVVKSSGNTSITDENSCYSLKGAKYGIYSSESNAKKDKNSLGTFTIKANGSSNVITLDEGTYYICETEAPKGYKKDTTIYSVTVKAGKDASKKVKDTPLSDPNKWQILKTKTGVSSYLISEQAVFKVEYFDDTDSTSGSAVRTWYVKTINGKAWLNDEDYYVTSDEYKSDAPYKDEDDEIVIPIGSIKVTEEQSPKGYKKTNDALIGHITSNGSKASLSWEDNASFMYNAEDGTIDVANELLPEITTQIKAENGEQYAQATESVNFTDTVHLTKLDSYIGKTVKVNGDLRDPETGDRVDGTDVVSKTVEITETEMDVDLDFTIDATKLAGKTIVARANVKLDDEILARHYDLEDEAEMIHFPEIKTTLLDSATESHVAYPDGKIVLIDTVEYKNLKPNTEYPLQGTLMDKKAEKALKDSSGNEIKANTTFTSSSTGEGKAEITFEFEADDIAGKTAVAFEEIPGYAVHADINDEDQTVHFPKIGTTAKNTETQSQAAMINDAVEIEDTVAYQNLIADESYKLHGYLVDKSTGLALLSNGKKIEAEKNFTASESGSEIITLSFNALSLTDENGNTVSAEGLDVVVFEELYDTNGKLVEDHKDVDDEGQTIHFPGGKTTAKDAENGSHTVLAAEERTIIDVIDYENLLAGKEYTITATLMVLDGDNEPYELTATTINVTAPESESPTVSGSFEVPITFDASELAGKSIVVFENVEYNGASVFVHNDLTDRDQTVDIPDGHTEALGKDTNDHIVAGLDNVTIIDTMYYENLNPATEYTVTGILMDKETGEPVLVDGKEVKNTVSFNTPDGEKGVSGEVEIPFTFNADALKGQTIVVFEDVLYDGHEVIVHHDINDVPQTVNIPDGHTEAKDAKTESHTSLAEKEAKIIDTVFYENLLPGKTYDVNKLICPNDNITEEKENG